MTAVVVVRSHASTCPVCQPGDRFELQFLSSPVALPAWCLHCGPARLPVVHLPYRADTPRKAT